MPIRAQNHGCLFSCVTPKVAAQNPLARSMVIWMAKSITATNQKRGATMRISISATTKCTRQCASSGNTQPTSAATGTADDIGGNDKADALVELIGMARAVGGVQRNSSQTPGNSSRYWSFMTLPEPECT